MKFEFVRNLNGGETLAKEIVSNDGTVLLKAGTKLTKYYINRLKDDLIYYIFIEDGSPNNVHIDTKIIKMKNDILYEMPFVFNNISSGDKHLFNVTLRKINDLIDYIIDQNSLNTNLYEISQYDNYTYIHSIDTGIMATYLGKSFNLSKRDLRRLGISATLHDIGKTKISENLLNKKDALTEMEIEEIRKHPIYSYEILKNAGVTDEKILLGVLQHHERMNGYGYPLGIKGNEISLFGKIIAICDVFTAISSNRTYRNRFNPNEAYEYIMGGVDTLFDSEIVDNFTKTFSIYPIGSHVKLSNGTDGYVIKQNINFPDRPVIKICNSDHEIDLLSTTNLVIKSILQ